jgi:hypothetical protein
LLLSLELCTKNSGVGKLVQKLLHGVAAGQLDKQAAVVQLAQSVFDAIFVQRFKKRRDGGIKADFLGGDQGVVADP